MATGAAVACPGRRVINLQADGSGLYSPQALWTQVRGKSADWCLYAYCALHLNIKCIFAFHRE